MPRATYGTVEVEVGKKKYVLKPTLEAYDFIEGEFGGLRPAIEAGPNLSIRVAAVIIVAGAGLEAKDIQGIKQEIFDHGLVRVTPKVLEFTMKLLNPSGKDLPEEGEVEGKSGET